MNLIEWLRIARDEHRWDLGDICLAQCEGPILQICGERIGGDAEVSSQIVPNGNADRVNSNEFNNRTVDGLDPGMFGYHTYSGGVHTGPSVMDTQHTVNGFEYPWADLWDLF
jgi:hypothetical protein